MSRRMVLMNQLIKEISMGPFGSDIKVDNYIDSGVPVLNGANISGVKLIENSFNYVTPEKAKSLKKANAKRGDIIVTHRGTLGQICYIPEDSKFENYVISQSQFRVTLKTDLVDPKYFVYYFHTSEGQKRLLANKSYVGVPALAQATSNFRLIDLPLPELKNQQKIAAVLSALDAKIELNNRINAELESLAKTIYDYWFVQLDFPNEDGKPYKSSGGKMVYVEGCDRVIPADWEVKDLGEFGVFKNGVNYDPSQPGDTPAKIVNVRNISKASIFIQNHDLDTINLTSREVNNYMVSDKSILIARSGIPGATRLISDYIKNTIYCGFIICFEVEDPNLKLPLFFFLKKIEKAMNSQSGGTIMKNVNQGTLKSLKILLPKEVSTNHLIKIFNNTIEPIFKKINLIDEENQQLTQLRDWLLPMLMNGQVSIK